MELSETEDRNDKYSISNRSRETSSVSKIKLRFAGFSDFEIWNLFRNGNKDAFIYIYYRFYPTLYSYGHQLSSDSELIEDCIQEVFFAIHQAGLKLSSTHSIKFYLMKSLKTKFLRTIKNTSRTKENEKHYTGYEFQFTMSTEEKIINAQLSDELLKKLNKALESLTIRQREVVYYFYYENLSIHEIAEIMGVSNKRTIQNLIYRSISFLRNHLDINSIILLYFICSSSKDV